MKYRCQEGAAKEMASRAIEGLTHDFGQIIDVAWLNRSRCNGAATVK